MNKFSNLLSIFYFFEYPRIKIIAEIIINGNSKKPNIVDSIPTKNEVINASIKMNISHIRKILYMVIK